VNLPTNAQGAEAVNESGDFASDRILARIGQLTRTLRDSMRELGSTNTSSARRKPYPMHATV